jgi:hypothetical protein
MLNGDAHYSCRWELELRIWPLLIIKDSIAREHNRSRSGLFTRFPQGSSVAGSIDLVRSLCSLCLRGKSYC